MCQSSSIFLASDCLSVATFFRQMGSSVFSVATLFVYWIVSFSEERVGGGAGGKKKRAEGGWERRQSIKTNWRRGMRVRYQKTGWWGMNEIEYQTCCGLRGQGLYHSLLLKQQPPQRAPGSRPIWSDCIVRYLLKKTARSLSSSFLTHTHTHTHTQSLLTSYLERENGACSLLSP